jgi:hypothetical protein
MVNNKKVVNLKQFGSTGLRRYGPYVYEEFLSELRWPRAGKLYQEMADNDPVIGAILYLAEMLIRGTSWTVEAASTSKADIDAADFLESCMHDMEMTWPNTISEVLSMLTYGFSFHEIVYKVRRGPNETNSKYKSAFDDGRIGWRRLPIRSQGTLQEWTFNEEGDVVAFVQLAEPDYKLISIPMSKGLLFRTRTTRGNPEGKSLLRNAYRPWFFKKHFEEIEGIGIERDLAGFPVLQAPENLDLWNDDDPVMTGLRTRAEELVASIRRDSEEGVLLPFGWDLKLLASDSSRQIDIGDTIDRYDNRIAITMLSDIILIGSKSGSFALADTKQSMIAAALQAQLQNIADVFNGNAVEELFKYNTFKGLTALPKITPGRIQTPSLKEVALVLRAMGLNVSADFDLQNYLRKIMDMPNISKKDFEELYANQEDDDEDDKDEKDESATNNNTHNKADNKLDDTAEKEFEQNDQNYTGGEM